MIVAGIIAVIYAAGILTGTVAIVLLILAAVLVLTSLVGFCPLYALLGVNSCPRTTGHHH